MYANSELLEKIRYKCDYVCCCFVAMSILEIAFLIAIFFTVLPLRKYL